MFCKTCGKEYNEGSNFCIYCGAKIEPTEASAESAAASDESAAVHAENAAVSAGIAANPTESHDETAAADLISAPETPAAQPSGSVQDMINLLHSSVSYDSVEPAIRPVERSNTGESSYSFTVTETPQPEKPEKYYTFGHLALCLAAVAVMAIVAGVFAGLYFSAIA